MPWTLKISSALPFEVNDFPENAEKTMTQCIQGVRSSGAAKCTSVIGVIKVFCVLSVSINHYLSPQG